MRRASLALLPFIIIAPSPTQAQAPDDAAMKKALQDALKDADPDVKKALEKALEARGKGKAPTAASPVDRDANRPDAKRQTEKALKRYKAYLTRKPYHGWAFDKLVEAAIKRNALKPLVTFYEQRLEEEAEDFAARVVLARLYARTKQLDRSLELLKAVDPDRAQHPAMQKLLGELYLRGNQPKKALAILEQAATKTKDKKLLAEIHRSRGKAALACGDREQAVAAFRAIAELKPKSFNTRLDVADLLATQGLHKDALVQLAAAETLAGSDARKRCRVLSETGKLHERRIEIPKALAVYRQAIDLLGRGHWLKRELYERVLSIHRRSGKLDELIASATKATEAKKQDLDAREFLAQVFLAANKPEKARAQLETTVKDFPEDLKLSRRLLTVLGELKDPDAQIKEYQRILAKHPAELDLYLELGKVFATSGKFDQAKRQWERTLTNRLKDASLAVRLAELYGLYGQVDEAAKMYRRAMALEPKEIAHYADLSRLLGRTKREAEIPALLEQAEAVAAADASLLQQVGALWEEHRNPARALKAIQGALKHKVDPILLRTQAKLQLKLNMPAEAAKSLHQVVELAKESTLRRAAIDNLLRLARRQKSTGVVIAAEEAALKTGTTAVAPYLILGRAYTRQRNPGQAIRVFEALLEHHPKQEDAHRGLARLYEEQGEYDKALAHYQTLVVQTPQARRKYLKAIAEIHLARFEQDKAFACYDQILAASPNNPAAFKDVGRIYERLNLIPKARDCYQQAVRLKPDDPELRLKLARVLQRIGENVRARSEILAAVRTQGAEDDVREDARKAYYELVGSQGQIDVEVESLRTRIDNNPYDVEAPLILSDIYIREMEYELALELLEKLIGYQPRHPRLLEERARISSLMERYPQAIADYEMLWKLPKADRQRLALKIAEAAIKGGDLERAARAVETVTDAKKIAALYAENDLIKEAQAALEAGIQRDPTNAKLHRELADLHAEAGDRKAAIESMQAVLSLTGGRWKTVMRLGELYHQAGDKARTLACGRRLFALIRQKDDEDKKAKKKKNDPYAFYGYRYYGSRGQGFYTKRIGELHTYFRGKGLKQEFGEIGLAELKLQPTNTALLNSLVGVLRGDDATKGYEAITWVRATTAKRKKLPPGYTRRSFEDYLDRTLMQLFRRETKMALKLGMGIFMKAMAGQASEWELTGLVMFLGQQNREQEARGVIVAGLKRFPDSTRLLLAMADHHQREKRWSDAAIWFRKAIAKLEVPARQAADAAEGRRRVDLAFRQSRRRLLQGFPPVIQSRIRPSLLRRLFDLSSDPALRGGWTLGSQPSLYDARRGLARSLLKQKQLAAAKVELQKLLPTDAAQPGAVSRWSDLASLYHDEGYDAESIALCKKARDLERALDQDPLLGLNRQWSYAFNRPMQILARVLEKGKKPVEAYDLLRTYGQAQAGELLLTQAKAFDAAKQHYAEKLAAARKAFVAGDAKAAFALRDAGIKHAEILQMQKQWPAVLAAYEALIKDLPDDFSLYDVVAALHGRADRFEQAVTTHKRIIARKRELKRRPQRNPKPKGREITPKKPSQGSDGFEGWAFQNLSYSYSWRPGANVSVKSNYTAILKIYLSRKKATKAAEVMRQLAREDVQTFRWMGWSLSELIKQYRLGAKGIPILRLLYGYNKTDPWLAMEYGQALMADKKLGEARKVFERVVNKPGRNNWAVDQARQFVEQIDARENRGKVVGYASLKKAADDDPKNAKKRIKLARWLFDERRYAEAHTEVEAARKVAPHLKSLRKLRTDCLTVLGKLDLLKGALEEDAKRAKSPRDKLAAWIRLANLAYDPKQGVTKEVERCLDEAFRAVTGQKQYTRVNWYIAKGKFETAHALLRKELKKLEKDQWIKQYAQTRMRQLDFLAGKPTSGLDEGYKELEKGIALGDKANAFSTMSSNLRTLPNLAPHEAALLAHADKQPGVKKHVYRAAIFLALRKLTEAEQALDAAIALKPKETLYLHPTLVGLARARRDPAGALKRLEALAKLNPGSESRTVGTSVGAISERNAFRGEKGSLLFELGKVDQAKALWKEVHDPSDKKSLLVLSKLYREHDLTDDAILAIQQYLKVAGERESTVLTDLAKLYLKQERYLEALTTLEKAVILVNPQQRATIGATIQEVFRRAGRLPAYRVKLETKAKQDKNDTDTRVRLAQVLAELDDEPALIAVLERLSKKQNMAQGARSALSQLHLAAGRFDKAAEQIEAMLDGSVESWDRSSYCRRLADLYMKLEQPKKALAAIKKGHEDPDGPNAIQSLVRFLRSTDQHAAAIAPLRQLVKLRKKDTWTKGELVRALEKVKQPKEALAVLWPLLHDPRNNRAAVAGWRKTLLELVDAAGGDAVVLAGLKKAPQDLEQQFRVAALHLARRRFSEAVAGFQAIVKHKPDDTAARWELLSALELKGDVKGAIAALEHLIDAQEKESAVTGRSYQTQSLVKRLGQLYLRAGDPAAAKATWRRDIGAKFRPVQPYQYTYYNSPPVPLQGYAQLLLSHHFVKEGMAAMERASLLGRGRGGDVAQQLMRAGETERALTIAWRQLEDPSAWVVSAPSNGFNYFRASSNGGVLVHDTTGLLAMHAQLNRVPELEKRVRAILKREPKHAKARGVLWAILAREEKHAELLERLLVELKKPEHASSVGIRSTVVQTLIAMKRYADAIPHQQEIVRQARRAAIQLKSRREVMYSSKNPSAAGSRVRFQWGRTQSNSSMSGYSSYSSMSRGNDRQIVAARRLLMALLAKAGKVDEAATIEARELRGALKPGPRKLELAGSYAAAEVVPAVERLCAAAVADDEELLARALRLRASLYKELELTEPLAKVRQELLRHHAQKVDEAKYTVAPYAARARFLLGSRLDLALAKADIERCLADSPRNASYVQTAAWIAYQTKDTEGARRGFQRAATLHRQQGQRYSTGLLYGLGLTHVDPKQARPLLLRALANDRKHTAADEARKVLGIEAKPKAKEATKTPPEAPKAGD